MASQMTIRCVGCGDDKGTTKEKFEELLEAGKIENYLCRSCRPKKNKSKNIQEEPKDELVNLEQEETESIPKSSLPDWMKNYAPSTSSRRLSKDDFLNTDTCFRPDIYHDNKRQYGESCCNGCPMFEYCGCKTKKLKK